MSPKKEEPTPRRTGVWWSVVHSDSLACSLPSFPLHSLWPPAALPGHGRRADLVEPSGAKDCSQFIASDHEGPDRVGERVEAVPAYGMSFP